jgi:hypothetical protein
MTRHQKTALRRHHYNMALDFRADGVYADGALLQDNASARKEANSLIVSRKHRDQLLALLGS